MTITFRSNVSDSDISDDEEPDFTRGKALPPIRQANTSDSEGYPTDRGGRGEGMGRMVETPSMSGSEDYRDMQMRRPGMMDTPSSATSSSMSPSKMGLLQQRGIGESSESEESDEDNTSSVAQPTQPQARTIQSPTSSTSKEGSEANDQIGELPSMFQRDRREYSGARSRSPAEKVTPTSSSRTPDQSAPIPESVTPEAAEPTSPIESREADQGPPESVEQVILENCKLNFICKGSFFEIFEVMIHYFEIFMWV